TVRPRHRAAAKPKEPANCRAQRRPCRARPAPRRSPYGGGAPRHRQAPLLRASLSSRQGWLSRCVNPRWSPSARAAHRRAGLDLEPPLSYGHDICRPRGFANGPLVKPVPASEALHHEMTEWRRDFHRHPELSFEETRTAGLVAQRLRDFGLDPVEGIGKTGVAAMIDSGKPGPSLALRADMDALPMDDRGGKDWQSHTAGVAHTCGHDGHTAALLGVARHLAAHPPASGRVVLIFQPAEENGLGARAMIDDGLLDRFPFDEVYAFHNMPLLAPGQAGVRTGPTLNGYIVWEIAVEGV